MQGISHIKQGDFDVWCLTDGAFVFAPEVFASVAAEVQTQQLAAAGLDAIDTAFNAFLLRDAAGQYTLIDTGCGVHYGDIAGRFAGHLAALDVTASQISKVILTHLHGDHCGGALQNGAAAFAQADMYVHPDEAAYWCSEDHVGRDVLAAYAAQLKDAVADQDIAPGLRVVALPGHTPGHIGVLVGGGLLIAADIVHSVALQFPDPTVCSIHDMDAATATQSRQMALAWIADEGLIFSGGHILDATKFASLRRVGAGYEKVAL